MKKDGFVWHLQECESWQKVHSYIWWYTIYKYRQIAGMPSNIWISTSRSWEFAAFVLKHVVSLGAGISMTKWRQKFCWGIRNQSWLAKLVKIVSVLLNWLCLYKLLAKARFLLAFIRSISTWHISKFVALLAILNHCNQWVNKNCQEFCSKIVLHWLWLGYNAHAP